MLAWLIQQLAGCLSSIDRKEAHTLVAQGGVLVDVRSPREFEGGHPPEAVNIPVGDLDARMGELDRRRPVIVYCHSGVRATVAASKLRKAGYEVHNIGSLDHWYGEGAPAEKRP